MRIRRKTRVFGAQTTKRKTKAKSLDLNNRAKRGTRLQRFLTSIVENYLKNVYTIREVMSILPETKRKRVSAQTNTL